MKVNPLKSKLKLSRSLVGPGLALAVFCMSVSVHAQEKTERVFPSNTKALTNDYQEDPSGLTRGDLFYGTIHAPKLFREAVDKIQPSLVEIETFGGVDVPRGPGRGASFKPGEGPTTGIIISPDGYIVTSTFNFAKRPRIITVILPDGRREVAKLMGRDETRKICVLKIENVSDLPVPVFVDREDLKVGQWAISLGVGYGGDEPAISIGILSAKERVSGKAIQTDANISPANYGGPLVDIHGRVMGVCVPLTPRGQGVTAGAEWYDSGIGFAAPLAGNERIMRKLMDGQVVRRGVMGIVLNRQQNDKRGVTVGAVSKGSPAARAGLRAKDVIIEIGGVKTPNMMIMTMVLNRYIAGDEIEVTVLRNGASLKMKLTLAGTVFDPNDNVQNPTTQPATQGDQSQTPATQPADAIEEIQEGDDELN